MTDSKKAPTAQGTTSLKLGSAVQMLPIVAGYSVQLVCTPYIVARLGLHDFGIWAITGAIVQYGALLDLGASRATVRYVALFHTQGDAKSEGGALTLCITMLLALWAFLSGVAVLAAHPTSRLLGLSDPALTRSLLLSSVAILFLGLLGWVLTAASIGIGRVVPTTVGLAILSVLQASGGVAGLALNPSLTTFAYGSVAGSALGFAVVLIIKLAGERRIPFAMPTLALTREFFGYAVTSQIAAAADTLVLQSGKLIAGLMIGPSAAGVYELANRLAMGAQVLGSASASTLTPHLTQSYISGGMDGVLHQYEHLVRRNTSVSLIFPFSMAATAISAITVWLGHDRQQVIVVLLALLIGIAVNLSTAICSCTLSAIGRPAVIAKVSVATGVFQTIAAVAATYFWGFAGLAGAIAIGVPIAKFLGLYYMHAKLDIPLNLYTRGVLGPFAAAGAATVAALPFNFLVATDDRRSAILPFCASATVFFATYLFIGWRRGYLPAVTLPSKWLQAFKGDELLRRTRRYFDHS
ncbi:oligosaccharide flippase family protein [Mycolicibacterium aubagnense]|nr:oligosaccharide flippase family protein [Mycolicibacterium aubagnense]WGI32616.1 oligosaccharide flippase family protein [Mycolicibacterium aubagnense]